MSDSTKGDVYLSYGKYEEWRTFIYAKLSKETVNLVATGAEAAPAALPDNASSGDRLLYYTQKRNYDQDCQKACGIITLSCDSDNRSFIQQLASVDRSHPKILLDKLEEKHRGKSVGLRYNRFAALLNSAWQEHDNLITFKERVLKHAEALQDNLPADYTLDDLLRDLTVIGMIRNLPDEFEILRQNVLLKDGVSVDDLGVMFEAMHGQREYNGTQVKVESAYFSSSTSTTSKLASSSFSSTSATTTSSKSCPAHPNVSNHALVDCFLWKAFLEWNKETKLAQDFATKSGKPIKKPTSRAKKSYANAVAIEDQSDEEAAVANLAHGLLLKKVFSNHGA